jgi:hypothetical protein
MWVFPFDCSDIPGKRTHGGARGLGRCACPDCIADSNDFQLAPVHHAAERTNEQTVEFFRRLQAWVDSKKPGYTGPRLRKPANWEIANTVYLPIYMPSVIFSVPTPLHLLLGLTNMGRRYLLCVCREADAADTGKTRRLLEVEIEKQIEQHTNLMNVNKEALRVLIDEGEAMKSNFESEFGKENMLRVSRKRAHTVSALPEHEQEFWNELHANKVSIQTMHGALSTSSNKVKELEEELEVPDEAPAEGPIEREIISFLQRECNCLSAVYHGGE